MEIRFNDKLETYLSVEDDKTYLYHDGERLSCHIELQLIRSSLSNSTEFIFIRPDISHKIQAWTAAKILHKTGLTVDFHFKDLIIELGHVSDHNKKHISKHLMVGDALYVEYKSTTQEGKARALNEFKY